MDDMNEFRQIFFTECAELLSDMEARLLNLGEGTQDNEQLNAIFRCAHSIKGGSGAFGLNAIMQFTHALEALLDKMRDGSLLPTRESIDVLLKSADIVTQMLECAKQNQEPATDFGADVLAKLHAFTQGSPLPAMPVAAPAAAKPVAAPTGNQHYMISFKPHEGLFASGNDPLLILRELGRLCIKARRVSEKKDEKTEKAKETAYLQSVEQINADIEVAKTRLEFNKPQPISLSSANPSQYVHAPVRNYAQEGNLATHIHDLVAKLASRRALLYSYCLDRLFELQVSSAAENIFENYRSRVDNLLGQLIPEELRRLDSIADNMNSDNPEDWANAVHSCRRLLQALADHVYPSHEQETVTRNGKNIKIGKDNYINRLAIFCEDNSESSTTINIIGSELSFIGDRLDAAFNATQKGSHNQIVYVQFLNGSLYAYKGVPEHEFTNLKTAASVGSYLNRNYKNVYPYEKVG